MQNNLILGLLGFTCCICIFLAWFFTHKARHKERLLMIEKGMDPQLQTGHGFSLRKAMTKLGIVIVGLGLGLALIALLVQFNALGRSGAVPVSILAISGGSALLYANRSSNNKN